MRDSRVEVSELPGLGLEGKGELWAAIEEIGREG